MNRFPKQFSDDVLCKYFSCIYHYSKEGEKRYFIKRFIQIRFIKRSVEKTYIPYTNNTDSKSKLIS